MTHTTSTRFLLLALLLALVAGSRAADRIELTDGSVIIGKLLSADGGKFKVETGFAGKIEIAQDKIRSFTTDEAVNVAVAPGNTVQGRVAASGGELQVVAAGATLSTTAAKVTAVWRVGEDSPEVAKLRRKWKYEAGLAINGRSGGSQKFAGALTFKATLASSQDKLVFDLAAEKATDNGVETANRQAAGVDYSSLFTDHSLWYARTSLEKDEIKALDLRSTTAFGVGRKLIKNDHQDLEARIGLNYIYESYSTGKKFDSPGLDLGLIHSYQFKNGKLNNTVTFTPAFKDFSNYRIHHESTYEMPISASMWKLKIGVTNDYTSIPPPGVDRLDTLYFTSLILNWE